MTDCKVKTTEGLLCKRKNKNAKELLRQSKQTEFLHPLLIFYLIVITLTTGSIHQPLFGIEIFWIVNELGMCFITEHESLPLQ